MSHHDDHWLPTRNDKGMAMIAAHISREKAARRQQIMDELDGTPRIDLLGDDPEREMAQTPAGEALRNYLYRY